jgi:uncharacterized protein (TIGR00369 family)
MEGIDPGLREAASALQTHLGFALTGWADGWARVELPVGPHLGNRHGMVHGGIHATLLDTAMGYSGCYTGDPARRITALTLSLTVNYLSPVRGLHLIAEGTRSGGGRSTFFASGRLTDETGAEIASATGVFRHRETPPG